MKLDDYLSIIECFLKEYAIKANAKGYVLGLSGGVDSSLCAALARNAVGKENMHCLMMPIDSHPSDLKDALEVAKALGINYTVLDMSDTYHRFVKDFEKQGIKLDQGSLTNLKVRMRMSALYAYGQNHNYLVIGTDNADERYTGYFTKYGDGAADVLPIAYLVKHEVVEAAKIKGVPSALAERVPSAGLFEGQTDEKEMGVTYKDLDDFLLGKTINKDAKSRIERLHLISEHKRNPIPTPIVYTREKNE